MRLGNREKPKIKPVKDVEIVDITPKRVEQRTISRPHFNETQMRDTLMCCSVHAGTTEYATGVLVGVFGVVMALSNRSWHQAYKFIRPFLPQDMNLEAIPESWREDMQDLWVK